jgi:hypothetical protein
MSCGYEVISKIDVNEATVESDIQLPIIDTPKGATFDFIADNPRDVAKKCCNTC